VIYWENKARLGTLFVRKRPRKATFGFSATCLMSPSLDPVQRLDAFIRSFSYPAQQGLLVKQLLQHPVHARADRGNAAAYFSFEGLKSLEAHISEIPAGQATQRHRHTCEVLFYVLAGRGYSVMQAEGQEPKRLEWQAGDLFFTPLQAWHWHVNTNPSWPTRYLEVTTIPLMKALGAWAIEVAECGTVAVPS
jgi:quercetin dioxygenase-like cupin family protein